MNEKPLELTYVNPQDLPEVLNKPTIDLTKVEPKEVIIPGYEDKGVAPDLKVELPIIEQEVIVEETIYDKYADLIKSYEAGVVRGMTYAKGMEILRYCEKIIGNQIPMDLSCSTCVNNLVKLFVNLKNK